MTPITYSLKQGVNKDLKDQNGIKHIILLTDGGENCDESPCDYAIELIKERKDIKIDVIAFNVHDSNDLDQLKCVADVTSAKFIQADTKAQLINSMEEPLGHNIGNSLEVIESIEVLKGRGAKDLVDLTFEAVNTIILIYIKKYV